MPTETRTLIRVGDNVRSLLKSAPGTGTVLAIGSAELPEDYTVFVDKHPGSEIPCVVASSALTPMSFALEDARCVEVLPQDVHPLHWFTGSQYGDREDKMYSVVEPDGTVHDFESCVSAAKFAEPGWLIMHLGFGVSFQCEEQTTPMLLVEDSMQAFMNSPQCSEVLQKLRKKL